MRRGPYSGDYFSRVLTFVAFLLVYMFIAGLAMPNLAPKLDHAKVKEQYKVWSDNLRNRSR